MILRSFGCSFVYGSDLQDQRPNKLPPEGHSLSTWPALLAKDLGIDYRCYAKPGIGNLQIMESILRHCKSNDIVMVNWSWIDRFDFINKENEKWETLRPSLDHKDADHYFRDLHGQYRDMLTNLVYVKTAIDFLLYHDIKFFMTNMDDLLFDPIQQNWHDPTAVTFLQSSVRPYLKDFEGKNFLEWSRSKGFQISPSWHPLEDAHQAAADYFIDTIRRII